MICVPAFTDGMLECSRCHRPFGEISQSDLEAIGHDLSRIVRRCSQPTPGGLGTLAARLFSCIGLTKERYARFVAREGHCVVGGMHCILVYKPPSEPTCNCARREAWLDRWGQSLVNRLWRASGSNSVSLTAQKYVLDVPGRGVTER